jgi:23S rRNA-/tRNA-specific pseudouridylate synthase
VIIDDGPRVWLWKPPGLPVFPPHADPAGDCVLARYLAERPSDAVWPRGFEGGIAHRLDNLTQGWVLAGRDPPALAELRRGWRDIRKFYRFRSDGALGTREVNLAIGHHPRRKDRMVVRDGPRARCRGRWLDAWTAFRALEPGWFEAEIRSGVMHQVRVHAAAAGVALTGDPIYGDGNGLFFLEHTRVMGMGWRSPS